MEGSRATGQKNRVIQGAGWGGQEARVLRSWLVVHLDLLCGLEVGWREPSQVLVPSPRSVASADPFMASHPCVIAFTLLDPIMCVWFTSSSPTAWPAMRLCRAAAGFKPE